MKSFIRITGVGLLLTTCWTLLAYRPLHRTVAPPTRPNIVFILADDLGLGDVSGNGFGASAGLAVQTPHIDSLMRSGIRFTNFYANSSVCSPSRAALLTGRYPEQAGVPGVIRHNKEDSWGHLRPGMLLPNYLKQAGYHTALIGKWHLGTAAPNLPNERGFDHFYGFLDGMMDNYETKTHAGHNFMRQDDKPLTTPGHATEVFTEAAIRYLNDCREKSNPFFLYLPYTAPHDPLQPPATYLNRVLARAGTVKIDTNRAKLVALIEHLDEGVGRVIAALRANRQLANTLIVFTSDNGGWGPGRANNGPVRGNKGEFYEGGIRIASGVSWPGNVPAGQVSDTRLQLMDWFPTLLEVAGIRPPADRDGRSFRALLSPGGGLADSAFSRRPLFFVRREGYNLYKGLQIHAVQRGGWKLLQPTPFAPYELYDLTTDPKETTNLAASQKAKREQLTIVLMEHIRQGGAVPWQADEVKRE